MRAACMHLLRWARVLARSAEPAAGTRKEVTIAGEAVLLFWYRNEIYAIEARQGQLHPPAVKVSRQLTYVPAIGHQLRAPTARASSSPNSLRHALRPCCGCSVCCMLTLCSLQDYAIECPTTSSTFSLKTGEIMLWCAQHLRVLSAGSRSQRRCMAGTPRTRCFAFSRPRTPAESCPCTLCGLRRTPSRWTSAARWVLDAPVCPHIRTQVFSPGSAD